MASFTFLRWVQGALFTVVGLLSMETVTYSNIWAMAPFHSGRGAIQSCVQAKLISRFATVQRCRSTGGQDPGGVRKVSEVIQELLGMGVGRVGIVSARISTSSMGIRCRFIRCQTG